MINALKRPPHIRVKGKNYYLFGSKIVRTLKLSLIDTENENIRDKSKWISQLLSNSSSRITYRFIYTSGVLPHQSEIGERSDFNKTINIREHELYIAVEYSLSGLDLFKRSKKDVIPQFEKEFSISSFKKIFRVAECKLSDFPEHTRSKEYRSFNKPFIDVGTYNLAIFRIKNLSNDYVSVDRIGALKGSLGYDFDIVTTVKPYSKVKSESFLRRLSGKRDGEVDLTGAKKKQDTEETLSTITLEGGTLCEFDLFLVFKSRGSSQDFYERLESYKSDLGSLAEFELCEHTALSDLYNLQVGAEIDAPLLETTSNVVCYIPCFTKGDTKPVNFNTKPLVLQRSDESLTGFDYFNKSSESHNHIIIGGTGKGKSVFTGLLIDNLSRKEDCVVQVLDVGSSHKKTVEELGGKVSTFSLNEPSGLNPFKFVTDKRIQSKEKASILSDFISNLVLEVKEDELPKRFQAAIQKEVLRFVEANEEKNIELTIDEFLDFSSDFERKDLLKRYGREGMYKNAFMPKEGEEEGEAVDLQYFDFEEIFQATDTSFSKAGMSALITCFTYLVLTEKDKYKVLIIDECPIFIKENYEFLSSAASNIRKIGGSLCIVAQTHGQVCPEGKTKLISQLKNKILYSVDGKKEEYISRLDLSDFEHEKIKNLGSVHKLYSEVYYTNGTEKKTYIVQLTSNEYYKFTTDKGDKNLIKSFVNEELGIDEGVVCDFLIYLEKEKQKFLRLM